MPKSQNTAILAHLRKGNGITSLEALTLCGSLRLAARIAELKDMGHKIKDRWEESNGKRFKRYYLAK